MSSSLSSLLGFQAPAREEAEVNYTSFPIFGAASSVLAPQQAQTPQILSSSSTSSVPLYFNVESGEAIGTLPVYNVPSDPEDDSGEEGETEFDWSSDSASDADVWGDEMALFGGLEGDNVRRVKVKTKKKGKRNATRVENYSTDTATVASDNDESSLAPLETKEVAWMPDSHVSRCYSCSTQFTLTRRRHHCRVCGMVFCGKCSSCWVETAKGKVRCCKNCAKEVEGNQGEEVETKKSKRREKKAKSEKKKPRVLKHSSSKRDDHGVMKNVTENHRGRARSSGAVFTKSASLESIDSSLYAEEERGSSVDTGTNSSVLSKPEFQRLDSANWKNEFKSDGGIKSDKEVPEMRRKRLSSTASASDRPNMVKIGKEVVSISTVESSTRISTGVKPLLLNLEKEDDFEVLPTNLGSSERYTLSKQDITSAQRGGANVSPKNINDSSALSFNAQSMQHLTMQTTQLLATVCPAVDSSKRNHWLNTIVKLSKRSVDTLSTKGGTKLDPLHYIHVKTIPGAEVSDSAVISGVVMRKMPIKKSMIRTIHSPRILLLKTGISFQRSGVVGQKIASIDSLLESEEKYMEILCNRIESMSPDVLLTGGSVCNMAQSMLAAKNILVLQNVKARVMERVSWECGATVLVSLEGITSQVADNVMGECRRFRTVVFRDEDTNPNMEGDDARVFSSRGEGRSVKENVTRMKMLAAARVGNGCADGKQAVTEGTAMRGVTKTYCFFEGCPKQRGSTVVLRGGSREALKQIKRVFQLVVNITYNLRLETSYLTERYVALPRESARRLDMNDPIYSSSLAVDFGRAPFGRSGRPWVGTKTWEKHAPKLNNNVTDGRVTAFDHQSILVTSIWLAGNAQCSPAEVKGICYYTEQDVSLGQFLRDSCFNLGLKCQNPTCKKSVLDHTLSFLHKDGQINITVEQMDSRLPPPPRRNQSGQSRNASNDDCCRNAEDEGNEESPDGYVRDIKDQDIAMWSYCHKCRKVVTPLVYLSEDTSRFSFGKFLEVSFYNKAAFMNLESSTGCNHNMQTDTTLYFGCRDLAARFTYVPIRPYNIFARRTLSFDAEFHRSASQLDATEVMNLTTVLFHKFKRKTDNMSSEIRGFISNINNRKVDLDAILSELGKMSTEIQGSKATIESKIASIIEMHKHYVAKFMGPNAPSLLTGLGTPNPATSTSNAAMLTPEDVLRFPWLLRRNLFVMCCAWNDRLSLIGQALSAMRKLKDETTPQTEDSLIDVIDRVRNLMDMSNNTLPSLGSRPPSISSPVPPAKTVAEIPIDGATEPTIDSDTGGLSLTPPKNGGIVRPPLPPKVQSVPNIISASDSSDNNSSSINASRRQTAATVKSAINRLFNRGNKDLDPNVVDISELARGRPRLEPGLRGEVIPVYEDQPSTVVAYSLSSREYHDQYMEFLEDGATSRDSFSRNGRSGGDFEREVKVEDEGVSEEELQRLNRSKSLEGVYFPGKKQGGGTEDDDESLPAPRKAKGPNEKKKERAKELERRMLLRSKTHVKHHFRDSDSKGQTLCKYVCTSYWATQFQAVRKAYLTDGFGNESGDGSDDNLDNDASYVKSLATSVFWDANGGKSGAAFAKTADGRFVVKCISRTELQMFLDCAPAYFEYLSKAFFHGLPTVLCKIVGVYQIGYHNRATGKRSMEQVAVMQNIFYGRKIGMVFDLKGSTRNRYVNQKGAGEEGTGVTPRNSATGAGVAEERFTDGGTPVGGKGGKKFWNDTDNSAKEDADRVKDFDSSSEARERIGEDVQGGDEGPGETVLLDENFLEFTKGRPLPLTDRARAIFHMSILNDTLFLSIINIIDYSILVGIDEEKHELVVGIIDYMRQYDIIKQMERVGKSVSMIAGAQQPTIIQPNNYKTRFQNAMERFFTPVPTKWTSTNYGKGD